MSQQETNTSKSAQLYAMRDGLSQISWLCQVLDDFAKMHKTHVTHVENDEEDSLFWVVQKSLLKQFANRYQGTNGHMAVIYQCFEQLSDDVRTFANEVRTDPDWLGDKEDAWGIRFLSLLDAFHEILNGAIRNFLSSRGLATDVAFETFIATHEDIQEKLVDLLHFTYDCDTKMGSSAMKQRIQRDYEWTRLCNYCVWITTSFTYDRLGPVDRLYADSMTQKEALEQQLHVYIIDCTLNAKKDIQDRRDAKIHAPAGPAVKKTPKKARRGKVDPEQSTQMTDLLAELRACMY